MVTAAGCFENMGATYHINLPCPANERLAFGRKLSKRKDNVPVNPRLRHFLTHGNFTQNMTDPITIPQMGIADIDAEHAGLLDCLLRLQLYIDKGHGFAASIDAVQALKQYALAHFTHEEAFLREKAFPKLEEHIEQHRAITDYVTRLHDRLMAGEEIEVSLINIMREWILKHIGVEDMEFAAYFGTSR